MSSLSDDITIIFLDEGVSNLVSGQKTEGIGCKSYAPMLKLFKLYEIDNIYACQQSLDNMGLLDADRLIDVELCSNNMIIELIHASQQIVQF